MDLFDKYHELPVKVKQAIDNFNVHNDPYAECRKLEHKMSQLGYSMDWSLDGIPFNLQKK